MSHQKLVSGVACLYCSASCPLLFVSAFVRSWLAFPHGQRCMAEVWWAKQTEGTLARKLRPAISTTSTRRICQNPSPIPASLQESRVMPTDRSQGKWVNSQARGIILPHCACSPDVSTWTVAPFCVYVLKFLKMWSSPACLHAWAYGSLSAQQGVHVGLLGLQVSWSAQILRSGACPQQRLKEDTTSHVPRGNRLYS